MVNLSICDIFVLSFLKNFSKNLAFEQSSRRTQRLGTQPFLNRKKYCRAKTVFPTWNRVKLPSIQLQNTTGTSVHKDKLTYVTWITHL